MMVPAAALVTRKNVYLYNFGQNKDHVKTRTTQNKNDPTGPACTQTYPCYIYGTDTPLNPDFRHPSNARLPRSESVY